ncbi:MAG TPA: hypothetical protein PJ994_01500 [Tepidiformaceae bacterium]|nr:hypothetical protein [Tepidiformaceae bacterium]
MKRVWIRRTLAVTALLVGLAAACGSDRETGAVHVIKVNGTVGPIMERYIDRTLTDAERSNARAAVLAMDTPGGLSTSMRDIVKRIERADVPVIVYVSPLGSRAASAGTFITMAGHIAAMAPNTSIGAASAINADGSDIDGALGRKIENDAVAFIRGIAELRGRNADWAEAAVREAVAVNQTEAVELNVVDFVANDLDHLLAQAEGRTVELRPGVMATLTGLPAATRVDVEMTVWEHILDFIADPTIASLLISLGFLGILIEMGAPGLILPGVGGAIAMMMGFLGFGLLPVDVVGLILIGVGLFLVSLEVFLPGGLLGGVGAFALLIGAIIAFRDTPAELRPPMWLVIACVAMIAAVVVTIAAAIAHADRIEKRQAAAREAKRVANANRPGPLWD